MAIISVGNNETNRGKRNPKIKQTVKQTTKQKSTIIKDIKEQGRTEAIVKG